MADGRCEPRAARRRTARARPSFATRSSARSCKRGSVWIGLALAIVGRHRPRPAAAADLRRHRVRRRCSTAARACSAGCCRSAAAGGWPIVTLAGVGFVVWTFYFAGTELAAQAERAARDGHRPGQPRCSPGPTSWAWSRAASTSSSSSGQLMGSLGRLGSAVSSALGRDHQRWS